MKILVSWVAFNNDFDKGQVKMDGPTINYHRHYYNGLDKHIILSSSSENDTKAEFLAASIRNEFKNRLVEIKYMGIEDVVNINLIREKIEPFLLSLPNDELDIFMSPGTPSMQIVWYLCHSSLGLKTSLYQLKELRHSDKSLGIPERIKVSIESSFTGYSALVREGVQNVSVRKEDYRITTSIKPIYEKADLIANADAVTTLIYGESGTGKEHLARYIHEKSSRKDKEFIAVNCSAFTDELLESRLLGHRKGAFTGAIDSHIGFFEAAKGGTIFLDEIGDISPYMQQLLLRVIQEKKILPIGENKERKIDVRIIAATNRDLIRLCGEDKFRWDLYYRLVVTELNLPRLIERGNTERKELLDHFLVTKKELFKRSKKLSVSKDALQVILNYSFPGNVRELENLVESLYVFNEAEVNKIDLPERFLNPTAGSKMDLNSVEKSHIERVLKMTKSNAEACRVLNIALNTLKAKIKLYDLNNR